MPRGGCGQSGVCHRWSVTLSIIAVIGDGAITVTQAVPQLELGIPGPAQAHSGSSSKPALVLGLVCSHVLWACEDLP